MSFSFSTNRNLYSPSSRMYLFFNSKVCQVITLDLIFFLFYQSCRYLASNMNTHRNKKECVVIMFYIVYYRLCFQHRLDNSVPCGQPLCVYNTNGLYSLQSRLSDTQDFVCFNNRGNRLSLVSCQSSLLNSLCSCFSSPV